MPEQIRQLLSPEAKEREAAVYELFGNIYHQGTLYTATAPAVPFLVEVARSDEARSRVRVELLWLLDAIAGGGTDAFGKPQGDVAAAAREAVRAELPALLRLVDARDEALALSAAAFAARFPEDTEASAPLVRARFAAATEHRVRRLLAGVLVLLGDREDELVDLVRTAPEDDVEPEYRDPFPDGEPYVVLEDLLGAALRARLPEHE